MIAQIRGKILSKTATEIIVDCNGVGYQIIISLNTSINLPEEGAEITILTLLIPREDAMVLYGFWSKAERELFKTLISISGIGPKSAISILSSVTVEELQLYIIQGNLNALQKLPGIGKKTAERLLLELKGKIDKIGDIDSSSVGFEQNLIKQEAMSALLTLGYSRVVAEKSIKKAFDEIGKNDLTAESLIKLSLKYAVM